MIRGTSFLASLTAVCMLLGLWPAAAFAADSAIVPRTTMLDLTGSVSYVNTDGRTETKEAYKESILDSAEGWSWNRDNKTLTLSGADIQVASATGNTIDNKENTAAICLPKGSTIELSADTESKVKAAENSAEGAGSYGIYSQPDLRIEGAGTLHVSGGAASGNSGGIYTEDSSATAAMEITGSAIVSAEGGEGTKSFGIHASKGIQISGSADVTAVGSTAKDQSAGIYDASDIGISIVGDANVTARGGDVSASTSNGQGSSGICSYRGNILISHGTVDASSGRDMGTSGKSCGIQVWSKGNVVIEDSGAVEAIAGYGGFESHGIDGGMKFTAAGSGTVVTAASIESGRSSSGIFADAVTIDSATVHAGGGKSMEEYGHSFGIRAQQETIKISGSADVTAFGGEAEDDSVGISAFWKDLSISDTARVLASGGKAKESYGIFLGKNSNSIRFDVSDSAQVTAKGAEATVESNGIRTNKIMNVTGNATINAEGGDAISGDSYGINGYLNESSITFASSGTLTALGGAAADGKSNGIKITTFAVSNGTVTAKGEAEKSKESYGIAAYSSINISGGKVETLGKHGAMTKQPELTGCVLLGKKALADEFDMVTEKAKVKDYSYLTTQVPVAKVSLISVTNPVYRGATQQLTAVSEFEDGSKLQSGGLVNWKVAGAKDRKTSISSKGLLTVSAGETAQSLTITAESKADTAIADSVAVTILKLPEVVKNVSVSPAAVSVNQGENRQFNATTEYEDGTRLENNGLVTWKVEGAGSGQTAINSEGMLTVARGENAETLTVSAVSNKEPSISASAIVTVQKVPFAVKNVTLSPTAAKVRRGNTQQFNAATELEDGSKFTDNSLVSWTVAGAKNGQTVIGESGLLTVGSGETATSLTVTATSKEAPAVTASAVVTVTSSGSGGSGGSGGGSSSAVNTEYTITAKADSNGNISPDGNVQVTEKSDQTFTITPDAGYEIYDVLLDGVSVGQVSSYTLKDVRAKHTIEAKFVTSFKDVAKNDWYYKAVQYAAWNKIFNGTAQELFSPETQMSRAMLATVLYHAAGEPQLTDEALKTPFADVDPSSWYGPAVCWAKEQGIVSGVGENTFLPDASVTREEFVQMLYRYAGSPAASGELSRFSDAGEAGAWAIDALRWAVANNILSGKGNGALDPKGYTTRAEAASMLMQYLENKK